MITYSDKTFDAEIVCDNWDEDNPILHCHGTEYLLECETKAAVLTLLKQDKWYITKRRTICPGCYAHGLEHTKL